MSFTRTKRLTQELLDSRSSFASENVEQLPWKLLANAIILKAIEDYEHGVISEREIMWFINPTISPSCHGTTSHRND